ncbi:MAG: WG repeat-containing protein, partial [Pyrinomonadaceae bacterium]
MIAVCLTVSAGPFMAQDRTEVHLYQIMVRNKSGFIDQTGMVVIRPQFDGNRYMLSDFSEGLAEFKDMKALTKYPFSKEGYIDKSGRIVIRPQFDVAYDFSDGRAQVK